MRTRNGRKSVEWRNASDRRSFAQWAIEALESRQLLSTDVLTYRYDQLGTGANTVETALTPANVNTASFGKRFSTTVDGQVYAQPLTVSGVNITTGSLQGTHDVVYVATEHDSLYALDANTGQILWHDSFINPSAGITTEPTSDIGTGDISPEYGITSTPVIDSTTGTLYVVVNTKEVRSDGNHNVYKLHAIDLGSGADKPGGPATIADTIYGGSGSNPFTYVSGPSVTGTGYDGEAVNGVVYLNAERQGQRSALRLVNGTIYIAFASHGDIAPDHGWILGYNASNLQLDAVFNDTPNGDQAGIWMSGNGIQVDAQGNLYIETGNGAFDPTKGNYGDSFVKLAPDGSTAANPNINGWGLKVVDYFTPYNQLALNTGDVDLGSGGILLLPDSLGTAAHPHLMLGAGKEGKIYLIDRDNMGKYNATSDNVVQEASVINGAWSSAALLGSTFYYATQGDVAKAFTLSQGQFATTPSSKSSDNYGYPGSSPVVSASGTSNGIVWTLDIGSKQIRAYNAANLGQELYNSAQASSSRDALQGSVDKFTVPVVDNGSVYVGTSNSLTAYGLLSTPPAAPSGLTATATSTTQVSLAWTDNSSNETGFLIEDSTDGTNFAQVASAPANATSLTVNGLTPATIYTFRVRATNSAGNSAYSNTATATTLAVVTPPTAPSGLTATATSTTQVSLAWTDNSSNETGFLIEDSTDGTNFAQVASTAANITSYALTGLTPATIYTFRVRATNSAGNSAYSNTATATTPPATTAQGSAINLASGFKSASSLLTLNGNTAINGTRLTLTNNVNSQTSSAFATQPVPVGAFSTNFQIQLSNPVADGMTFTIQGNSPTALGKGGGGLGSWGIAKSVSVKFDIWSNAGEGTDSTGLFINGAYPTTPATDLTPTGVNLRSGDVFSVAMTYDGTNLKVTIVDTTTGASASQTYAVNIPSVVGASTAYVGFTGATGGAAAKQEVLDWSYVPAGTLTAPWTARDIGAPLLAGGASAANGVYTVAGAGSDIWNTSDQFQFVSQPVAGDATLVARLLDHSNTNVWAKSGLMFRASTSATAVFADVVQTPDNMVHFQWRDTTGKLGEIAGPTVASPAYLKLVRAGNVFTGYASTDGKTWTTVGSATVVMPAASVAGLAVTSHNSSAVCTATFDSVTLSQSSTALPTGWSSADIGAPAITGSTTYASGAFTVTGSGAGVRAASDQFQFASQSLTGDTTITARLVSQTATDGWAKSGVMIRATSDPGSPYVAVFQTVGNGLTFEWRTDSGAIARYTENGPALTGPVYLQVTRVGNAFTGSYSTDGVNFTPLGTVSVTMPSAVLAGLATTSHNVSAKNVAVFDTVSVATPTAGPVPAPWMSGDIGAPSIAGTASAMGGTFTVTGSGAGVRAASDQFQFVDQMTSGDTTIVARLDSQTGSNGWAKSGVMIRATSDPGSSYVGVFQTVGNGLTFEWRTASGAIAQYTENGPALSGPIYLKLVRSGSTFTGYYSTDGVNYTLLNSAVLTMASNTFTGLAVTSHDVTATNTATFDKVSVTSP